MVNRINYTKIFVIVTLTLALKKYSTNKNLNLRENLVKSNRKSYGKSN